MLEPEQWSSETEYDALGRVSLQHNPDHPNHSTTRPEYHQSGRLNKIHVKLKGEPNETTIVTGITYNPKSQREKITYDNNTETIYTYEKTTFRLTSLITTRTSDNKKLQEITYVYDPVGNLVKITNNSHNRVLTSSGPVDPKQEYTYDPLYRLVKATGRMHKDLTCQEYKDPTAFKQSIHTLLNDLGKLRKYTREYTYDEAGNLEKIQQRETNPFTRNIDVDINTNRAILHNPSHPNPDFNDYFDANGNQTKFEPDYLPKIEWNYRDNISQAVIIERPGSEPNDAEYYVYDTSGQRVRKVKETFKNGQTIKEVQEKIYIGNVEVKRIKTIDIAAGTEGQILERFDLHVMDDKNRIAIDHQWTKDSLKREIDNDAELNTNKKRYQYSNHLGSASLELDDNGKTISYEEYFPYGETSFIAGDKKKEVNLKVYRFTGKERDDSTGLYYFGARYYASWLGRWCSCDPAKMVDGTNLYIFVRGNPIVLKDKKGLQGDSDFPNYGGGPPDEVEPGVPYKPWDREGPQLGGAPGMPRARIVNGELQIREVTIIQRKVKVLERKKFAEIHGIVLHQTEGPTVKSAVETYKTKKEGAHFTIAKSGEIYQTSSLEFWIMHVGPTLKSKILEEGKPGDPGYEEASKIRGLHKLTEHELKKSFPDRYPRTTETISIEVVGEYPEQSKTWDMPTAEQEASLTLLVDVLMDLYNLEPSQIYKHPQLSHKNPGEAGNLNPFRKSKLGDSLIK